MEVVVGRAYARVNHAEIALLWQLPAAETFHIPSASNSKKIHPRVKYQRCHRRALRRHFSAAFSLPRKSVDRGRIGLGRGADLLLRRTAGTSVKISSGKFPPRPESPFESNFCSNTGRRLKVAGQPRLSQPPGFSPSSRMFVASLLAAKITSLDSDDITALSMRHRFRLVSNASSSEPRRVLRKIHANYVVLALVGILNILAL